MTSTIHIEDASGADEVPDPTTMRGWIEAALTHEKREGAELSLRLVNEAEITALNSQFRNKSKPTNVLSFPAQLPAGVDIPLLGDIAVCAQIVAEEARDQHKSLPAHWAHILVHGTLHLLGYDHIDDADANEMETMETTIITQLGFPPPYKEQPITLEGEQQQ